MQQIFNRKVIQKIMALLVILVLSNFIMSTKVYAADESSSSVEEYDDSESDSGFFGVPGNLRTAIHGITPFSKLFCNQYTMLLPVRQKDFIS